MSGTTQSKALFTVGLLAVLAVSLVFWRRARPAPEARPAPGAATSSNKIAASKDRGSPGRAFPLDQPRSGKVPALHGGRTPAAPIVVGRAQVLAHVDGVAITGKDLLAFGKKDGSEQTMTPEMFAFLRERAIDRELAVQAGKSRGVALGATEKAQLESVRQTAAQAAPGDPDHVEFDVRDAEGPLLLDALIQKQGGAPGYARQEDIDRYYQEHRQEFDDPASDPAGREATMKRIDLQIRQVLNSEMQRLHQEELRKLTQDLRAAATISD